MPPYDCILYPFKAECNYADFQYFNSLNIEGITSSPQKFIINIGEEIPFYIDSYYISMPQQVSLEGYIFPPIQNNRTIINGHFDSKDLDGRDLNDFSKARSNGYKRKETESIKSRWEILDL